MAYKALITIMLASFAAMANAEANITSCVAHTDFLGIEQVSFKPDPVKIGKVLRVKVVGRPIMDIDGGTVFISVMGPPGFDPFYYTADLCDVVNRKCPLKEGKKFKAKAKVPIFPVEFPPGNYTARAEVESTDGELQLTCINAELDFVMLD